MAETNLGRFPSENIPIEDKRKKPEYSLLWSKAIFQYGQNDVHGFYVKKDQININRTYGRGRQDCTQYQNQLDPLEPTFYQDDKTKEWKQNPAAANKRSGYLNIAFKPLPIMAQWRDHFIGKHMEKEYEIICQATDEFAETDRNKEKESLWFHKENKDLVNAVSQKLGVDIKQPDYQPDTRDELDIYFQLGAAKLNYEIALEEAMAYGLSVSEWLHIKHRLLGDIFDLNECATIVRVDDDTQMCVVEYCDVSETIMQFDYLNQDFKNAAFAGVRRDITVAKFRSETGLPEKEVYKYVKAVNDLATSTRIELDGMDHFDLNGYANYDNMLIPCWYMCWKGYDQDTVETDEAEVEVSNPRKNEIASGKVYEKDSKYFKKVTSKTLLRSEGVINVYDCMWVENSDFVWNVGLMSDQIRVIKRNSELPISKLRFDGASLNERIQPYIDDIHTAWYRFQNKMATADYSGTVYNLDSIIATAAALKSHPTDILKNAKRGTGDVVIKYDTNDVNQHGRFNERPFAEKVGGYESELTQFSNTIMMMFQLIQSTLGMANVSQQTQDNKEIGVGTVSQIIAQTDINLRPFADGYIKFKNTVANKMATVICGLIIDNDIAYESYLRVIGEIGVKAVRELKQYGHLSWGIIIESKPTDNDKLAILKRVQEISQVGSRNGEVTILASADFAIQRMLDSRGGVRQAQRFLSVFEARMKKEKQDSAQQQMAFQTQMQQASEKQKADQELALIKAKGEEDRKTLTLQYQLEHGMKKDLSDQEYKQDTTQKDYLMNKQNEMANQSAVAQQ